MKRAKERIVVTGGAGFIGSRLANYLQEKGHEVLAVDNLAGGNRLNLNRGVELVPCDIRSKALEKIYRDFCPTRIFHFAAQYANELSLQKPREDLDINAGGTLAQLLLAEKTKPKRFVFASSSCVYEPCRQKLTESNPLNPHTPYGLSKYTAEKYCRLFSEIKGIPYTILRYFNIFGPPELLSENRGVIARFIRAALEDKPLVITGTGKEGRDFTYIEDAVRATVSAGFSPGGEGEEFNIGTGELTTIEELIETFRIIIPKKFRVEYRQKRHWDKTDLRCADIKKAKKILGYDPRINLQNGLKKTWEWYLNRYLFQSERR